MMAGIFFFLKEQNSLEVMNDQKEMTPNRVVNRPFRTLCDNFPSEFNYCEKERE